MCTTEYLTSNATPPLEASFNLALIPIHVVVCITICPYTRISLVRLVLHITPTPVVTKAMVSRGTHIFTTSFGPLALVNL